MGKTKRIKRNDSDNEPAVLTGLQEAELIEYVNWSEGDAGLRSAMGQIVAKKADGTYGIRMVHDPEDAMIRNLDRIKRHRTIHRAMRSIGKHERTLRNAYTVAPKPPYIVKYFGHWCSGVALAGSKQLARLVTACHLVSIEGKGKYPMEWKLIHEHQVRSLEAYQRACRAYLAAIELAKQASVVPEPAPVREALGHRCRVSVRYPCPCGES